MENLWSSKWDQRGIVKRYEQKTQIDFDKTFALVIKWNIVRLVMALTIHTKWELLHLDVMAFLMMIWRKDIFMMKLKGFEVKG